MCLGIPARVVAVDDSQRISRPGRLRRADGGEMKADLAMVPEAMVGDYVITHSGFAVAMLAEEEAKAAMNLLDEMREG